MGASKQFSLCQEYLSACKFKTYRVGAFLEDSNRFVDCASFIGDYATKVLGDLNSMPDNYERLCKEYFNNKEASLDSFYSFIKSKTELLPEGNIYVGDIMVMFSNKGEIMATGINAGNAKAIIITEDLGAVSTMYGTYASYEGRRWLQ